MSEQMDLMRWLSDQFGRVHYGLGQLQAGQAENRRTVLAVRRELSERMDRLDSGRTRGWIALIPFKIVVPLVMGGIMLITGHMTVPEVRCLLGIACVK